MTFFPNLVMCAMSQLISVLVLYFLSGVINITEFLTDFKQLTGFIRVKIIRLLLIADFLQCKFARANLFPWQCYPIFLLATDLAS